jgi:ATP-dependent Clp endopeptidase proteolytic subunit ClpP
LLETVWGRVALGVFGVGLATLASGAYLAPLVSVLAFVPLVYQSRAIRRELAGYRQPAPRRWPFVFNLADALDLSTVQRPQWSNRAKRTPAHDWFRISNAGNGTTEVYIYDEIGFWGTSAADFIGQLQAISTPNIDLHVNSPGGEVFDGIAIYNAIRNHPAEVTVYVDGLAASAASFIAMSGNRVVVERNAQMMIHDAIGVVIGNATEMRTMAELLGKLSDNIADIYAQKAGGTVEHWRNMMLAETWFSAAEAVAAGLADEMTGAEPDDAEPSPVDRWDLSIFAYAGREHAPAPATSPESEPTEPAPVDVEPVSDDWFALASGLFSPSTNDDQPFAAAFWERENV